MSSFKLDAGYFDAIGSVRLQWFDLNGNLLGQQASSEYAIQTFGPESGNIASWRIETIAEEPAGFAVDNVIFKPTKNSSLVFREKKESQYGFWGLLGDEIPGFDHVGFNYEGDVYESHPGYDYDNDGSPDIYVSADGTEKLPISIINGVQKEHTLSTFKHSSTKVAETKVIDIQEITISDQLAEKMADQIDIKISEGAKFAFLAFDSLENIELTMSPTAQKGKDNTFTCVGLIEWAAEKAGHKSGEGFVKNSLESFNAPIPEYENEDDIIPTIVWRELPLLSPQLMYEVMAFGQSYDSVKNWFVALFDPVDFMITGPYGLHIGYTPERGKLREFSGSIYPGSIYTGDGYLEIVVIPNPIPGEYSIEYIGKGERVNAAWSANGIASGFSKILQLGEKETTTIIVPPNSYSPGDLNGDELINYDDLDLLISKLNTFSDNLFGPADLNRDGKINSSDKELLQKMIDNPVIIQAGDINSDGLVDIQDFKILAASFGSCSGDNSFLKSADIDSNGCVDFMDYQSLKSLGISVVSPVYRFYSPSLLKHLFTIDENEKEHLISNAADVWRFEGIAYYAFHPHLYNEDSLLQKNTLKTVHRFYSEGLQTHLFTTDENERDHLIANAADVWRHEGVAFYVTEGYQEATLPVYRFYSEALMVHLFTLDENEKNHLIENASEVWRFEGIAYYSYP